MESTGKEKKIIKKNSLKRRMVTNIILFAIAIIITTGTVASLQYNVSQMNAVTERAFNLSRTAASLIDGDRVLGYVETGEKDDYYYQILDYLNTAQIEAGLKYYYVFVPYENDLVYVWDAVNTQGACDLGHHEAYMSERSKAATFSIFRKDPPEKISLQQDSTYGFIASAYSPIFNSDGEPVAVAAVDFSIPSIRHQMVLYMLMIIASVSAVTLIALLVFYISIDRKVISPITQITESTTEMVDSLESDRAIEVDIHTGDELEELADAIGQMDLDLRKYVKELSAMTAERERIGVELNIAERIQAGMLPNKFPAFPDRNDFDLFAIMDPAKQVGGDFYDFFMTDDDHIALVMADVSGKGIPAALFMVVSKLLIKSMSQTGAGPAETLESVNERLLENNDTGFFVTVWLAVIDLNTGKGVAANAGHEHPALRKAGGSYELIKYRHSPAVSTMEGIKYREHEFTLEPGDSLFVYTDGVPEAMNKDDELFGEERLIETLNANADASPEELLTSVKETIDSFAGDVPQFDDITMLSFKYNGKA